MNFESGAGATPHFGQVAGICTKAPQPVVGWSAGMLLAGRPSRALANPAVITVPAQFEAPTVETAIPSTGGRLPARSVAAAATP
jgi:hypothetical protein